MLNDSLPTCPPSHFSPWRLPLVLPVQLKQFYLYFQATIVYICIKCRNHKSFKNMWYLSFWDKASKLELLYSGWTPFTLSTWFWGLYFSLPFFFSLPVSFWYELSFTEYGRQIEQSCFWGPRPPCLSLCDLCGGFVIICSANLAFKKHYVIWSWCLQMSSLLLPLI